MQDWSTPLKQWFWEEFHEQHVVRSALSLDSAKHLTASLAWNVHDDFLDEAYKAKTTEWQVPLEGNRPAVWHGSAPSHEGAGQKGEQNIPSEAKPQEWH